MVQHFNPEENEKEKDNKNLPVKCVHCRSGNFIKEGFRKTQKRGKIQKYLCLDCRKYFTADLGFYRMRNSEGIISMSVDMYLSNLSSRKMKNQLTRHMMTKISHVSVLDWVRKYVLKVQNYVDSLTPNIAGNCYADGTEITRRKETDIFWACVDWDTRFINGIHYSTNQEVGEAAIFLKKCSKKKQPYYIQTDAAIFYPKAFRKAFYSNRLHGLKVEHRVQNTLKTRKYNVRIETVFSKIKDRVDDFRGLKALWSAPILMAGIILQHNFIEKHSTTGKVPCELAGLDLKTGVDRWLGLIRLASSQN